MEHATFKRAILYVAGLLLFTAVMGFATSDSCTFARMYMSVNNQTDGDHTYQAIHVSPFSPMEICTDTELVASIQNGYTGYIYLGSPRCPYCRNTVPLLLEQAQASGISRILSCTLQNYNYRYEYTDTGLIETQHGTPAYDTLLQLLDAYTVPKRVTAPDGQTVDTGVRTIYMPAVLHCTNGVPDRCWQYSSTGITLDAGQSAYDSWTPAQQQLARESLQEFFGKQ